MSSFRKVLMVMLVVALAAGSAFAANVTFQVNMSFQIDSGNFTAGTDMVVARGSFNDWSGTDNQLTDDDSDGIYTGTWDLADADYEYKYVSIVGETENWEGVDNRTFSVAGEDVVLDVVWFNNQEPAELISVDVLFRVDMAVQELAGNFDYEVDSVTARGGTAPLDWSGRPILMTPESANENQYTAWVSFVDIPAGSAVEYKFFQSEGGDWGGDGGWETVDNRTFTPTIDDNGGEIILDLVYFDNVSEEDILTENLDVIFKCYLEPAYMKIADPDSFVVDVQTNVDTVWTIDDVYVQGFFSDWTWGGIGDEYKLFDNGVAPDEAADDHWFAGTVTFYPGENKNLIYKFGINALDVEAGFAQNHEVILSNDNPTQTVVDTFGTNGTLYDPYIAELDVREIEGSTIPERFTLEQNYPNPFNPSTTIAFNLATAGATTFKVFNIAGQEVYRSELGNLKAGRFEVTLDASNFASGVYFYRVETNGLSATKRMMLLK